jgi:hypothetical protein
MEMGFSNASHSYLPPFKENALFERVESEKQIVLDL